MKRSFRIGYVLTALAVSTSICFAASTEPAAVPTPTQGDSAHASDNLPMVPPAAPGVFTVEKKGADRFRLILAGHKFNTRDDIEKYLAYRAAELTREHKASWFTFVESRSKGDSAPEPRRDPAGLRYSFRMDYFRPVWRYKTSGSQTWKTWSPFSGAPFIADDQKSITDFEVSADIVLHRGQMDDANPLAFDAEAVSDLLINQVSPPQ